MTDLDRRAGEAAANLSELLSRVRGRRLRALSRADLRALPARYRQAITALAEGRAAGAPPDRLAALESLVLSAHALLYAPEPIHLGRAFARLLAAFPAAARRLARAAALCAALLAAGGLWGFLEVRRDAGAAAVLLSRALQQNAESFQAGISAREGDPVYGAFYFTNNARAAFAAFALGATLGAGTVLVLLYNGVVLGATVALVAARGSLVALLSYVLPHSGVELTALVLAAAAGLHLASGLARPGPARRLDALARAGREALPVVLGAASLLTVAGLTEGWISPQPWPLWAKAAAGGALDLALGAYLLWPVRRSAEGVAT